MTDKNNNTPVAVANSVFRAPPTDRRIANKDHVWHWIKRGVIMQLHFDLETGGVDKREAEHPVRGFPVITEYGDALADIAGNYLNSAQIFPRRPEWLMIDPAAPLVQRMTPYDYDSPDRPAFFHAMGMMAERIEQAPYQYGGFGDEPVHIAYTEINKRLKNGQKPGEDDVIPIPLRLPNGEISFDVRWHPNKKKISFRIDNDPDSHALDNDIYVENVNGKEQRWKWKDAVLAIKGFNSARFDLPVTLMNLARSGFHPSNIYLAYSQSTISHKQKPKNYHFDVRQKFLKVSMHGPQGEEGLHIGQKMNPVTGEPYNSETLSTWMQSNQRFASHIRGIGGGIFLENGQAHDPASDHGAVYDSKCSLAGDNYCMDIAGDICAAMEKQTHEETAKRMLTKANYDGDSLPLFALPQRHYPEDHVEGLYLFMNTDEQMGGFKKYIFAHVDGKLSEPKYNGKCLHEMSVNDFAKYIQQDDAGQDLAIRLVGYRKWPYPIPFNDLMTHSTQADRFHQQLPQIDDDLSYLKKHKDTIFPRIYSAIDAINHERRFVPGIHTPLLEDEWTQQGFGDIAYQDEEIIEERIRLKREQRMEQNGPQALMGILETVKNKMQKDADFMHKIDKAMMMLTVTALPADYAQQIAEEKDPQMRDLMKRHKIYVSCLPPDYSRKENKTAEEDARGKFNDLARRIYTMLRKEDIPYVAFLQPYFEGKNSKKSNPFKSLKDVEKFRDTLGLRALRDYEFLIHNGKSEFAQGFVDRHFCHQTRNGKPLLLFASLDRGDKGAAPHIIDQHRREVPHDYIKQQEIPVCIRKLESGEWQNRFYRLRSDPIYETIVHRFIDTGKRDKLSAFWQQKYDDRKRLRLEGAPNETAINSRHSNIRTFEHDCKRLAINANARDPAALEREVNKQLGLSMRVGRFDESQANIAQTMKWGEEIRAKHLPPKPKISYGKLYDPATGLPYDYIPNKIPKENHVIIDIPAWHLRHPVRQYDESLPFNCLVIAKPDRATMKKIRGGAKVLLREEETGRTYSPGPISWHTAPRDVDSRYAHLNESARQAYQQGGQPMPPQENRVVIGIEDLYPVANTRRIRTATQTLKIPHTHFDGLVYPGMIGVEAPLTAAVVPLDYCPQRLVPHERLRLREMNADMFDNIEGGAYPDTGHIYDTQLKNVVGLDARGEKTGISIRQLFNDISSGRINEKVAQECGFLGRDHMENRVMEWSLHRWGQDLYDEKVLLVQFNKTQKRHWAYFNPPEAPLAAITVKGERTPPSAYQDMLSPRRHSRR